MILIDKNWALLDLEHRMDNSRPHINNATDVYAGGPMFFYCIHCNGLADIKPELYTVPPRRLCVHCELLLMCGFIEVPKYYYVPEAS